ncbi:hypothetical protein ACHAWF_000088, partial [Thalassiosira exigua]
MKERTANDTTGGGVRESVERARRVRADANGINGSIGIGPSRLPSRYRIYPRPRRADCRCSMLGTPRFVALQLAGHVSQASSIINP